MKQTCQKVGYIVILVLSPNKIFYVDDWYARVYEYKPVSIYLNKDFKWVLKTGFKLMRI